MFGKPALISRAIRESMYRKASGHTDKFTPMFKIYDGNRAIYFGWHLEHGFGCGGTRQFDFTTSVTDDGVLVFFETLIANIIHNAPAWEYLYENPDAGDGSIWRLKRLRTRTNDALVFGEDGMDLSIASTETSDVFPEVAVAEFLHQVASGWKDSERKTTVLRYLMDIIISR